MERPKKNPGKPRNSSSKPSSCSGLVRDGRPNLPWNSVSGVTNFTNGPKSFPAKAMLKRLPSKRALLPGVRPNSWRQLRHDEQAQDEQRDEHREENSETHPQQIRRHDAAAVADFLDRRTEVARCFVYTLVHRRALPRLFARRSGPCLQLCADERRCMLQKFFGQRPLLPLVQADPAQSTKHRFKSCLLLPGSK